MTKQEQLFVADMTRHYCTRLHKLIADTGETCMDGDLKPELAIKVMIQGLLFELIELTAILQLDEDSFLQVCRRAHREMRPLVAKSLAEFQSRNL